MRKKSRVEHGEEGQDVGDRLHFFPNILLLWNILRHTEELKEWHMHALMIRTYILQLLPCYYFALSYIYPFTHS